VCGRGSVSGIDAGVGGGSGVGSVACILGVVAGADRIRRNCRRYVFVVRVVRKGFLPDTVFYGPAKMVTPTKITVTFEE
jgi:hypothetical protein